ncbi:hypothetical protein [Streptomyces bungoensis]
MVRSFVNEDHLFDCQAAEFVCRALVDPHHTFTLARWYDTPFLENYRASD